MRSLSFRSVESSADVDVLAGSELEFAPGDGVYTVRASSTVNTATLAMSGNRSPVVSSARSIILRANAELSEDDAPWIMPVEEGEKITVSLSGTTGTIYLEAAYVGD